MGTTQHSKCASQNKIKTHISLLNHTIQMGTIGIIENRHKHGSNNYLVCRFFSIFLIADIFIEFLFCLCGADVECCPRGLLKNIKRNRENCS